MSSSLSWISVLIASITAAAVAVAGVTLAVVTDAPPEGSLEPTTELRDVINPEPANAFAENAASPAARDGLSKPIGFEVCEENHDWRRPEPDEMARTVWRDNRYKDLPSDTPHQRVLEYYAHHFFVVATPTANGVGKLLDWTGLSTARPHGLCGAGGKRDQALAEGREVAVYVFGYRVTEAALAGEIVTITMESNASRERGYAIIRIARPQTDAWVIRFALPDGRDVGLYRYSRVDAGGRSPPICCANEAAPLDTRRRTVCCS